MNVERIALGPLETNAWLVDDGEGGPVLVIDPGGEPQVVVEALAGRSVAAIVLTHGHFDHIGAVSELARVTGAPVVIHALDAEMITDPSRSGGTLFGFDGHHAAGADRLLADGDTIDAGTLTATVLHTPGHTPGSICLLLGDHLFSGDTVFAGSVGRTDFPGGDPRALQRSIATRIAPLPSSTFVHPGHGPGTTVGRELKVNPFFPRA